MARGIDSAKIILDDLVIEADYTWHRYIERHEVGEEHFLDWDYKQLFVNGRPVELAAAKALVPDLDARFDRLVSARH